MYVYNLFKCIGDPDSNAILTFIGTYHSPEAAKERVACDNNINILKKALQELEEWDIEYEPMHDYITPESNFTAELDFIPEFKQDLYYGWFGGYFIIKTLVQGV